MRRRTILALLAFAAARPALAAEEPKKGDGKKEEPNGGFYVDIAVVGLPVIADGRLLNYIFTQVRLNLAPGSNTASIRTKEPYFRDALIRAAHRGSLAKAGSATQLDEAVIQQVMMAEAAKIVGPKVVVSVKVMNQTPQRTRVKAP